MIEKGTLLREAPHSSHYKGFNIEPLQYIEANDLGRYPFHVGNIIKLVSRFEQKDGINDLHKALFYIERLIELEEDRLRMERPLE